MEQPNNTYLATSTLTLADGVARLFCWNYGAQIAMADALAIARKQALPANGLRTLRDMVWAGCKRDAEKRGEEWTPEKVEDLIPMKTKLREDLERRVMQLVSEATREGENEPAAASAKGAPAQKASGPGGKKTRN